MSYRNGGGQTQPECQLFTADNNPIHPLLMPRKGPTMSTDTPEPPPDTPYTREETVVSAPMPLIGVTSDAEIGLSSHNETSVQGQCTTPLVQQCDRLPNGRFGPGSRIGGNAPHKLAHRAATLRKALFAAVTPYHLRSVIANMIATASDAGDKNKVAAAKLILEYTLGSPESIDLIKQVATLRAMLVSGASPSEEE